MGVLYFFSILYGDEIYIDIIFYRINCVNHIHQQSTAATCHTRKNELISFPAVISMNN